VYLLSIEAFNPVTIGCSLASKPVGCGDQSGVPCERGPQNIAQLQALFWGIPTLIVVFGSIIIMILLYFDVSNRGQKSRPKWHLHTYFGPNLQLSNSSYDSDSRNRRVFLCDTFIGGHKRSFHWSVDFDYLLLFSI